MQSTNFNNQIKVVLIILNSLILLVNAHGGDGNEDDPSSISITTFLIINLVILIFSLGLVILIDNLQSSVKIIAPRTAINIIVVTLIMNAILAVNTYVEVN